VSETSAPARRRRIGLIGCGFVGAEVFRRITAEPSLGLDVAFVWNRSAERLDAAGVPPALRSGRSAMRRRAMPISSSRCATPR
jgi:hypothetical protein